MATKPPVYARINWRQRLLAALRSTSALVAAAYVLKANSVKTSALEADIRRLETERALTVANVKRLASYTALITLTARRFGAFSDDLTGIAQTSIAAGVALGLDAARDMAGVQFGATEAFVMLGWNQPSAAQLARLTGYVESAAWKASASAFGRSAADVLSNVILTGVARGQGPRTIAATMRRALDTVPRVWAETTVRTAQIWGYRTAAHESYRANPDLVRGWIWTAALDSRTCLGCLSQHGTFHTNDETLNGHDGCRCAPIPVVRGVNLSIQTGPEWFDGLSGSTQRDIMGPSRYAAYKAGEFDWNNATSHYTHEPYGDMLRSATLDEMGIERVMP